MRLLCGQCRKFHEQHECSQGGNSCSGMVSFLHCKRCCDDRPYKICMRDYASVEVGLTPEGWIKVWCKRHEEEVFRVPAWDLLK